MKNKRINILFMVLTILFVAVLLVSCGNSEELEGVAEVTQKSQIATWFEDNLGWFIGIPVGVTLSNILEILVMCKKSKNYAKDLFENSNTRKLVKNQVNEFSETNAKFGKFITKTENNLMLLDKKIDDSIDKSNETVEKFKAVEEKIAKENTNIEAIINVLGLIASQNKDLVASGVAEEINKIVDSVKTK